MQGGGLEPRKRSKSCTRDGPAHYHYDLLGLPRGRRFRVVVGPATPLRPRAILAREAGVASDDRFVTANGISTWGLRSSAEVTGELLSAPLLFLVRVRATCGTVGILWCEIGSLDTMGFFWSMRRLSAASSSATLQVLSIIRLVGPVG